MKYRVQLGCVVAFFVSMGFAAWAGLLPGPPTPRMLELADANRDGFVTYDELRALMPGLQAATFNYWDANGQGWLRIADYAAPLPSGPLPWDLLEGTSDFISAVDTNQDGVISYEEALAVMPSLARVEFDRLDANDDGVLSELDLPPFPRADATLLLYEILETTEPDGITEVTFAEAQQYYPDLTQAEFNEMDCNGDGFLSRADFPPALDSNVTEEKAAKAGQVAVPNVVGLSQIAARTAITNALLALGASTWQYSATVASGNVISETPVAGTLVATGSAVNFAVSYGNNPIVVPNVVGNAQSVAQAAITAATLALGTIARQYNATVPVNDVVSEDPAAGTRVAAGTPVNLIVSNGPAPVVVPSVADLTQASAQTVITGAGLTVGAITQQHSATVAAGSVISQNPLAGTSVAPGTAVNLVVSTGPAPVTVPNVASLPQASAQAAITGAGLTVGAITQQNSATVPAGNVISQNPVAGTSVAPGTAVNLFVSTGPAPVTVPNVASLPQASAQAAITGAGLTVGVITQQNSATVATGNVISQNPVAGTSVAPGTAVNLVVSNGSTPVTVPNVTSLPQASAQAAITAAGLTVGAITQQNSAMVATGNVISQNPVAGTSVAPGTAVNLVVSTGPAPVTVPNVASLPQASAQAAITGVGLTVGVITQQNSATVPAGNVISQNPVAGMSVAPGTAVNLVVSSGPVPVTVPNVAGMTQSDAQTAIMTAGLAVGAITQQYSTTFASGSVISQNPAAGASVAPGTAVSLVISKGPLLVTVPSVAGINQAAAQAAIVTAGLTVGTVSQQPNPTVGAGIVIGQDPASGASVAAGAPVSIIVSTGPIPVTVPQIVDALQSTAQIAISNAGLAVGAITMQSSDTVPAGNVISQVPIGGSSVPPGTAVNLVVSSGPVAVPVPSVIGQIELDADTILTRAGLVIGDVAQQYSDTVPSGDVISQDPIAGASASPGTAVNLVVSIGHDPGGALQVTIAPATAVTAGGQWSVDGGSWQASGATVSGLSVGAHTVTFEDIASQQSAGCFGAPAQQWGTPPAQTITIVRNQTTTVTGTYTTAKAEVAGFAANGTSGDMLLMASAAATLMLVRKNKTVRVKSTLKK